LAIEEAAAVARGVIRRYCTLSDWPVAKGKATAVMASIAGNDTAAD
jgi:hypothetical protein